MAEPERKRKRSPEKRKKPKQNRTQFQSSTISVRFDVRQCPAKLLCCSKTEFAISSVRSFPAAVPQRYVASHRISMRRSEGECIGYVYFFNGFFPWLCLPFCCCTLVLAVIKRQHVCLAVVWQCAPKLYTLLFKSHSVERKQRNAIAADLLANGIWRIGFEFGESRISCADPLRERTDEGRGRGDRMPDALYKVIEHFKCHL